MNVIRACDYEDILIVIILEVLFVNKLVLFGFFVLLAGCFTLDRSEFASSDQDRYLTSKNGKDLLVPPPLTTSNLSDFYVLPDQKQNPKIGIEPPVNSQN